VKLARYHNIMNLLTLQLQQKERNFEQALTRKKQFWEIEEIIQRIRALKASLLSLDNLLWACSE
jgi:hypothetical protein